MSLGGSRGTDRVATTDGACLEGAGEHLRTGRAGPGRTDLATAADAEVLGGPVLSVPAQPFAPAPGVIRSRAYDGVMVLGVLLVALALGGTVVAWPRLFPIVLAADVWLFAYPHVTSTYTRIAFDRESLRRHWFLLFALPPLVLLATGIVGALGGAGGLFTVYFVGQTYHYTRQSYGIARAYRRVAGDLGPDRLSDAVVYLFPLWGLVHRAAEGHPIFFDNPLHLPRLPMAASWGLGAVAVSLLSVWCIRELRRPRVHTAFVASHVALSTLSYVLVPEITQGWLFINIWHNAQYLLFVWAFNARRFAGGVEPERAFVSRLCQPKNAPFYAGFCVLFGAGLYALLDAGGSRVAIASLPVVLVLHLSVNFHHYLVDGVIWTRKASAAPSRSPGSSHVGREGAREC